MAESEIEPRERAANVTSNRRRRWLRLPASLGSLALSLTVVLLLAIAAFRSEPAATDNWVRIEDMSQQLPLAAVAHEDANFCSHWGVDWGELRKSVNTCVSAYRSKCRGAGTISQRVSCAWTSWSGCRGASTITMQVIKNMYLLHWPDLARKPLEVPLAYLLSALHSKRLLLETYLNIVPWGYISPRGPAIVGAEAASQYYYGKSASALTPSEAARLAAALPCPNSKKCDPRHPSKFRQSRADQTETNMRYVRSSCFPP